MINLLTYIFISIASFLIVGECLFQYFGRVLNNENNQLVFIDKFLLRILMYGISVPLITLILYYSFIIVPNQSSWFYLTLVVSLFIIQAYFSNKKSQLTITEIKKKSNDPYFVFVIIGTIIFYIIHLFYLTQRSISENDYLEYGVLGNHFLLTKEIVFMKHRFLLENNFYYVGMHGFLFPLIKTWEGIINELVGIKSDLFYKSISGFYSFLIALTTFHILRIKISLKAAIIGVLILVFTYGFFIVSLRFHIDTLRIFFFSFSGILLIEVIKSPTIRLIILTGLVLGLHAFAHSIGVFVAIIWFFSFVFSQLQKRKYLIYLSIYLLFVLIFAGGIHYVLDVFIGTGWIFQSLDFY